MLGEENTKYLYEYGIFYIQGECAKFETEFSGNYGDKSREREENYRYVVWFCGLLVVEKTTGEKKRYLMSFRRAVQFDLIQSD